MDKVIQIANLLPDAKFTNSTCGRVYWSKGVSPCLTCCGGGDREPKILVISDMQNKITKSKKRYALGRTNHEEGYGTSSFHVNPYFNTVTSAQPSNRRQWIAEIR